MLMVALLRDAAAVAARRKVEDSMVREYWKIVSGEAGTQDGGVKEQKCQLARDADVRVVKGPTRGPCVRCTLLFYS
eukprot:scaffold274_cov144-Skeletonema_menzelii.AAC.34